MGLLDEAIREHLELKRRHGANPEDVARAEREALGPAVRERVPPASTPGVEAGESEPSVGGRAAERKVSVGDEQAAELEASAATAEPASDWRSSDAPAEAARADEPAVAKPATTPLEGQGTSPPPHDETFPPPAEVVDTVTPPAEPAAIGEPPAEAPPSPAPPADAGRPAESEPAVLPEGANPSLPADADLPATEAEAPLAAPDEASVDQPTEVFDADEIFADEDDEAFPARPPTRPAEDLPPDAQPREETPPSPAAPEHGEGEAEDVLEETPDFLQETPEHDRLWFEQRPPRDFDFDK